MQQLEHKTFGHYHLQSRLAKGGMAEVYLARDIETEQVVAVKLAHTASGDYYERFRREVRVLATLSHKHILPVLDYGEHELWYYLISPYIEYGTLSDRLSHGPLLLADAHQIFAQLAEALQYAHDQGIVHRDIKPSNVLMQDGTHVYLADFGLVKEEGVDNNLTLSGYLIGTPEYMAPELAEENASQRSDVYALGILLYQMLAGQVPFKASTPIGIYLRHIRDMPPLPSTLNPTIPPIIEDVVMHALEKDPERRFQSVHEFYSAFKYALEAVEGGKGNTVRKPSVALTLRKSRVTIVQQKHSLLRGRVLMMTTLLSFLLILASLLVNAALLPMLLNVGASNVHGSMDVLRTDLAVPSLASAQIDAMRTGSSSVSVPVKNLLLKIPPLIVQNRR
jgi:Serine/threonine protein kinase